MEETIVACTIEQCQTCVGALLLLKQFAPLYFVFVFFSFFPILSCFTFGFSSRRARYSIECSLFLIVEQNPLITRKGLLACLIGSSLCFSLKFILFYLIFFRLQLRGLVFTLFWCNRWAQNKSHQEKSVLQDVLGFLCGVCYANRAITRCGVLFKVVAEFGSTHILITRMSFFSLGKVLIMQYCYSRRLCFILETKLK